MSVEEMKIEAIRKIADMNNEDLLREILHQLETVPDTEKGLLSKHYDSIRTEYLTVLEKLAQ